MDKGNIYIYRKSEEEIKAEQESRRKGCLGLVIYFAIVIIGAITIAIKIHERMK